MSTFFFLSFVLHANVARTPTRARTLIHLLMQSSVEQQQTCDREIYRQMVWCMRTRRNKLFRLCINGPLFASVCVCLLPPPVVSAVTVVVVVVITWNQHVNFALARIFLCAVKTFAFTFTVIAVVFVVVVVLQPPLLYSAKSLLSILPTLS